MASYYHLIQSTGLLLAVQIILGTDLLVQAGSTDFKFLSFNTRDRDSFLMVNDVQHDAASSSFLMNPSGVTRGARLLYNKQVRMKDSASGAVASFHTAFTFEITGPDNGTENGHIVNGDGLAFTFARYSNFSDESAGYSLCLVNSIHNGMASNRVFAVEFDTFYNDMFNWLNEPSDSHIAVDINSVNSITSYNLCRLSANRTYCRYLCNGGNFTAWIDYDSASGFLLVFFTNGSLNDISMTKPTTPVIQVNLSSQEPGFVPLAQLVDDYMYVGFSSSTGIYTELNHIKAWMFSTSFEPGNIQVTQIVIGGSVAGTVALVAIVVLSICWWKYRHPLRIFVSHTGGEKGEKKNFPIHLSNALTSSWRLKNRFRVFIDRKHLRRGTPFPDEIQRELARVDLGIVVVTREFFEGKWPMMELAEMVKLQFNEPARVRILPLFYTLKPGEIRSLLTDGMLQAKWAKMATANHPIDVQCYEDAVEKLCIENGVEYNYSDLSHEEEYIDEILKEVSRMYREMRKKP
ncbi:hypothetical protein KC19_4G069000 [Ceratodon purpureus]|uniref:TIR domain-containing protein n=1 Tax=Ceratodon purpureus TaxID=3225 RepID=A0A8T0I9A7_CERPU|nr:hypothetical protein KC19_4G069000 [Ceratodon purpureus]